MKKITCLRNREIISIIVFYFLFYHVSYAQRDSVKSGWIIPATFCRPFLADLSSTITSVGIGINKNEKEYDLSPSKIEAYKGTFVANLGISIPVYTKNFNNNRFGWALSIPAHWQLWLDVFEKTTAPVLNTDYNAAVIEAKFIQRLNHKYFHNYSVKFVPFYHQSTHLGDELTIYRMEQKLALTRVNVSYCYWELSLWINESERRTGKNHSFRGSFMHLLNPEKGWYSIRPQEGNTNLVIPEKRPYEFYLQYQLQTGKYFLSSGKFQNVLSIEVRNRPKYNYPCFIHRDGMWDDEKSNGASQWNFNLYYGWRIIQEAFPYHNLGVGIQAYMGGNPHGQFRDISGYRYVGLTMVFE